MNSPREFLIVDGHEDLSMNALADGHVESLTRWWIVGLSLILQPSTAASGSSC
jgi:hypothetical protein